MYLNEEVRAKRREGGCWHRAIIKLIMNNGALVMVSWVNHDWDDSILPPYMILEEADVAGG
eukprot:1797199-Ditylum_brightwellii.AAC.1